MIERVAFRVDASVNIGIGHVMRCLTLADALSQSAVESHFICRGTPESLTTLIADKGHRVHVLPTAPAVSPQDSSSIAPEEQGPQLAHCQWLSVSQQQDASDSAAILRQLQPDWLIVDHYALDVRWEQAIRPLCGKLMAIDDLADRAHCCDLLLDQNLGRQAADYSAWVLPHCEVLAGSKYALLRVDFAQLRNYSIERRSAPRLRQLLISMGGVDKDNVTGQVLDALKNCTLPEDCRIWTVMGATAPWLDSVRAQCAGMPVPTEVLVNISDMAQRMADSDLAIGAAGGTSWERCCMGLPTLTVVIAENQWPGAHALANAGAGELLGTVEQIAERLPVALAKLQQGSALAQMIEAASGVTDGCGVRYVAGKLEQLAK
ncbi:UDP-2,4-diacetamido-2,4,6-trideoxy-beta-L-altropyranose hydrolase [Pseudomonas chlororaphis]|uniref:UDP-2,4-diacetamido-2,4, 6-trideoxy-beta-L-altropyranose hydrolase n=1 Tax=Pseudomonas chlororaphis TaxID=587753 RepID=UPI00209B057D|nr:UDP-2,4-diacetamido-2,4,6-trideoxy-beta-L-altropyranose hydrolase [Pseudomonas chlororaphis]MCO7570711.1 UDP-2,4-diacetamido-2,4,6-trideoxy-beta-L-altropyranose hydrolase [Pseudomonas chlororaphis]MCO7588769.1 UDP-2,4-diacetamido-2,4,6-trideoxy-beta-L-altropyranose hydrolase [Pseudomonas chlororaphis]